MSRSPLAQRLAALFAVGWLAFNFPLLGLWNREVTVLGLPLFPAALFALWLAMIVVLARWMEQRGSDE